MKKIFISLFTVIVGFIAFTSTNLLFAESYVGMIEETNRVTTELGYGVVHENINAQTKTDRPVGGYHGTGSNPTDHPIDVNTFYSQHINILNVPSSKDIKIIPYTSTEGSRWSMQKTRSHIAEFERKNPAYKVIGAVNGDFYDIQGQGDFPYQPTGVHAQNGDILKTSVSRPAIGFKNDGSLDSLVYYGSDANSHITNKDIGFSANPYLQCLNDKGEVVYEIEVLNRNVYPDANQFSVFYGKYSAQKKLETVNVSDSLANHFIIEGTVFPNDAEDIFARGIVTEKELKEYTLKVGQLSIVSKNANINEKINEAAEVRVQFKMTKSFEGIENAIGLHYPLVYNNERFTYDHNQDYYSTRAPRTIVGRKADGTIGFLVMDGRSTQNYGVNQQEMMNILQANGFVDGFNLDGGGSSTFLVRNGDNFEVCNTPSDGNERNVSNSILIAVKEPSFKISPIEITNNSVQLEVELLNKNGIDVSNIKVKINDQIKEVIAGKVSFDQLDVNTPYVAQIIFNTNEKEYQSLQALTIGTAKRKPILNRVEVTKKDGNSLFKIFFDDVDKSFREAYVIVNGVKQYCNNDVAVIQNFNYEEGKHDISVEYYYNLNNLQNVQKDTTLYKDKNFEYKVLDQIYSIYNKGYSFKEDILAVQEAYNKLTDEQKSAIQDYDKVILDSAIDIVRIGDLILKLEKNFDKKEFKEILSLTDEQKTMLGTDMMAKYDELNKKYQSKSCKTQSAIQIGDIIFSISLLVGVLGLSFKIKK